MRKEDLQRTLECVLIYVKNIDEIVSRELGNAKNQGIKANPAFSKMYIWTKDLIEYMKDKGCFQ